MLRSGSPLLVPVLLAAGSAPLHAQAAPDLGHAMKDAGVGAKRSCTSVDPKAVVVCGRRSEQFRIDRHVLESARAATAQPPRASLMDQAIIAQRYGDHPEHGRVIPNKLIGMPTGKGAGGPELAAKGKNLGDALRHGEDEYADYRSASEGTPAPR
jgi:hypothetical protein